VAQDAFNGNADQKSLTKQLDDIGSGIRSGFKSAMKELEVFIDQNRENRSLHLPVMQMIDSVRKKDPEAALRAAQTVVYHTRPQSDFEDMAVAKWSAIADDIAKTDIFKAVNGEIMFAAVLANADRHFKDIAIAKWEELFSRALHKDPVKAADIAEHTLEFAYQVRRNDVFPASTTERIIHVAKESLTLAELRSIRTKLDQRSPGPAP